MQWGRLQNAQSTYQKPAHKICAEHLRITEKTRPGKKLAEGTNGWFQVDECRS